MEKGAKGIKTKRLLYESAIALFREKGYDNVSVDEIAKKAGTAKGTFYIHFESKAAVIVQMLQEYDDYYHKVASELDPEAPVPDRLEAIVYSSCKFTQQSIGLDLIRVLYTNQLAPGQREQDALNPNRVLYQLIRRLLIEGQEKGVYISELDVEQMGAWLIRCIRGTFYEWCIQEGSFDLCEECVQLIRTFCRGMERHR